MVFQNLWDTAKALLWGKFIARNLPQETGKISHKQLNLTPKKKKEEQTNSKLIEGKKS